MGGDFGELALGGGDFALTDSTLTGDGAFALTGDGDFGGVPGGGGWYSSEDPRGVGVFALTGVGDFALTGVGDLDLTIVTGTFCFEGEEPGHLNVVDVMGFNSSDLTTLAADSSSVGKGYPPTAGTLPGRFPRGDDIFNLIIVYF
jgi:hypothetical protein